MSISLHLVKSGRKNYLSLASRPNSDLMYPWPKPLCMTIMNNSLPELAPPQSPIASFPGPPQLYSFDLKQQGYKGRPGGQAKTVPPSWNY